MKPLLSPLRETTVALAVALALSGTLSAAPKKPEPAPAVQSVPAHEKKSLFAKTKDVLGFKKKEQAAPQPAAPITKSKAKVVPAPVEAPKKPANSAPPVTVAKKAAPPATVAATQEPPKKSWLKRLNPWSKPDASAVPQLANAKTAKPAPVKEVKPAESLTADAEPKEKRGILGFFKKLRQPADDDSTIAEGVKIERPSDWKEHKVVTQSGIGIYSFGPAQSSGPDKRLESGTVVKVKSIRRGWALVEVNGSLTGYMDASALRDAGKDDFSEPPSRTTVVASSGGSPSSWAPLAPPPDLPDQPSAMDADAALLLLPPLELEPKPNP